MIYVFARGGLENKACSYHGVNTAAAASVVNNQREETRSFVTSQGAVIAH